MQAAFALARIAKEDAAEAVRLYFEPLLKLLSWARQRLSSAIENKDRYHLLTSSELYNLKDEGKGIEELKLSSRANYGLQRVRSRPVRRILMAESLFLESESMMREMSKINKIYGEEARLDALSSLLDIDLGRSALLTMTSLRSLLDNLESGISDVSASGLFDFRRTVLLLKAEDPSERLLLEGIELPQTSEIGRQADIRFGVYLEVAAFLAQEGYEDAALAVVARAFSLFRLGEINITRGMK